MGFRTQRGRLLLFILILMAFPMLNHHFKFIGSGPLKNVWLKEKPIFSFAGLWDGSYEVALGDFLNDALSFREDMIRFNNQVDFSIFNKVNTGGVVLGQHNNLFYEDYIESYCGLDYAGDNYPVEIWGKLKKIQDTLESMGKMFVFVYAGSKPYYYPEDIPASIKCNSEGKTNLKNYKRVGDSLGIHQIDFNTWYASLKGKTPHPLFNKQGIHWSLYGAFYAVDSLISYIEHKRNIRMMHPHWEVTEASSKARNNEDDIERILNLIYPIDTGTYWYPKWHYDDSPGIKKPRVIYIGDSFIGTLTGDGILQTNRDPQYWVYFRVARGSDPYAEPISTDMKNYDWPAVIRDADCVVMMYTSTQMVKAGHEFVNAAYDYYYPKK